LNSLKIIRVAGRQRHANADGDGGNQAIGKLPMEPFLRARALNFAASK